MKVLIYYMTFLTLYTQCSSEDTSMSKIIRQIFDIDPVARNYIYGYETENQIFVEEQGYSRDNNLVKEGQYQYTSPDGEVIRTIYKADEDGFHPQGAHFPTAPPLPPASFSFSALTN